ncbi:MAG: hypothetical protein OXH57_07955 [Ekhidna sp.]|nr:hypothetical protein [Ekhidna sp.]
MEIIEFQGSRIVDTPKQQGVYAWYYRPSVLDNREVETLGKLITTPSSVKTEIAMRYDLMWETNSNVDVLHGGKRKRQPANKVVSEIIVDEGDLIKPFFKSLMIPYFAKPLYIGQTDNLYRRVYKEHYIPLTELWEPGDRINKYLEEHPNADVQDVLNQFDINHSFAINARVIAPKDLVVCICPIDFPGNLRDLEQILQILADPICGRK